ncbi:MAG TPA: oxidoreductase [Bacteroidales bacterium]|nr:oxidoreductase [Bacteroidales bacterium]
MKSESINIGNFNVRYYAVNTLIIGSGAASLNSAVTLDSIGQKDIMIATTKWGAGTSNNAGSDKQTYYKLSLCGSEPDSVRAMAQDLFNGRCMHGDIALCEAQGSVQAFMKLVDLGVPFPQDKFGSWAGYRTDNDPRARATSAGPYTSKMMFTALSEELKKRSIKVLDNHHVVELLTDKAKTKVIGALAVDTSIVNPHNAFVLFNSVNIILGTGGPGDIYENSVYPLSQTGSTGMAFRAGATGQNLTETQFGIASLKFRWNLSGSYQQVIPRYVSTDRRGNDEKEFLNEHFPDYISLTKAIFMKGYQWPFDSAKVSGLGSSMIDLLVWREISEKGRRVFIDYRKNVSWDRKDKFRPEELDPEVRHYLVSSDAMQLIPIERLISMNSPAVELYRQHNIDLASEPLEIGVCAQHCNGGLKSNIWWESDIGHLFPVGEVNGSHGVYRPGGSALNSGQVGSRRAAVFINRRYNLPVPSRSEFLSVAADHLILVTDQADSWLSSGEKSIKKDVLADIRKRMSGAGSIVRDRNKVASAAAEAFSLYREIKEKIGASTTIELAGCFKITDACLTHLIWLEAIKSYIENNGRSRGSFIITNHKIPETSEFSSPFKDIDLCRYDREVEKNIQEVSFRKGKIKISGVKVREIPVQDLWFEKVWKDYLEDNYLES